MTAPKLLTFAQPAVIPTRPANAPFRVIPTLGLPAIIEVYIAATDAADADNVVVTAIAAKSTSTAAKADPTLNPYHPNHKINTPSAAATIELPGIGRGFPLLSNFPIRGPTTCIPARAAKPPTICTTPEPAKSTNPMSVNQP